MVNHVLEVCCFNVESCFAAYEAGADRIELCGNPAEGGITPGYGTISFIREHIPIKLFPIIRPRGGDFIFSNEEFEVMKRDIRICREMECDGVVVGVLTKGGKIDKARTKELVEIADPMRVTFHRAFDMCDDLFSALEDLIECGCERVLTSGGYFTATEGAEVLKQLVDLAGRHIIVMPGGGIRASNIKELAALTHAREFHSSARINKLSDSIFRNPRINFSESSTIDEYNYSIADKSEIERMIRALRSSETDG
ncbi:MAG TPA: copper homeostasis protein CutC [Parasegetibacter sp.]